MLSILTALVILLKLSSVAFTASTSTQQQCRTKLGKKFVQPLPTTTKTITKSIKTYTTKSTVTPVKTNTPQPKTTIATSTTTISSTITAPANVQVITSTETGEDCSW